MCAQELPEPRSAGSRIEAVLGWLGGGHWSELGERHERSTHAIAGLVVLLGAALAWIVSTLVIGESAHWPVPAILPLTLVFGLLIGAVARGTASGPTHGRFGILGRGTVAVVVGVVVGELAALVLFAGSIDHRLNEQAARTAAATPAVAEASAALNQTRSARGALDNAVEQARGHRDEALVIARCEYHPTPSCPQTRITGVPGTGPETRTANELLADTQRELDNAVADRDRGAPQLDATIAADEQQLAQARRIALAEVDRGLGARWVAMNDLSAANAGTLLLRLLTIAFFTLLYLLPLILRLWRGETTHDRHAAARAERDRAELEADTAIAVKRAKVRAAAETLWAEQQLASARLAVEAQTEIDRAQHQRRVAEAIGGPIHASSQREPEDIEDMYLPIAAEAEAASLVAAQLPAGGQHAPPENPEAIPETNPQTALPALVESGGAVEPHDDESHDEVEPYEPDEEEPDDEGEPHDERGMPLIPDLTKVAARWIRPLVPPFVVRAVDSATQPMRVARQVIEEVEEITFSRKRTRKLAVDAETLGVASPAPEPAPVDTRRGANRIESSRDDADYDRGDPGDRGHPRLVASDDRASLDRASTGPEQLSVGSAKRARQPELIDRDKPRELRGPDGPRELPPAE